MTRPLDALRIRIAGLLIACWAVGCAGSADKAGPKPLDYVEVRTRGAGPDQPLPMIAFVHGFGGSPELFTSMADELETPVRLILPRGPRPQGFGYAWFGRCDDGNWDRLSDGMAAAADRIAQLLDILEKSRPTRGRPILSGFSQGGMLAFAVAVRHPSAIRLAIPISGLLPRRLWPARGGERPIWPRIRALHGALDRMVPTARSRETVAHLKQLGIDAELAEFPGVAHDIDSAMMRALNGILDQALRETVDRAGPF